MTTRRRFLVAMGGFLAAGRAFASPFRRPRLAATPIYKVYFGSDTSKGTGKGIYRATFNATNGQLTQTGLVAETVRPFFLALGPATRRRMLYAANAVAEGSITGFVIDPRAGDLQRIGQKTSGGGLPCYISIDSSGHAMFVADYAGGVVSSYRIEADGGLTGPVDEVNYKEGDRFGEDGPVKPRQDGPHPHSATISPDNRFLVVCDLGHDRISIFAIDPETAKLRANEPHLFSNNRTGTGPRHVVFHPNQRWVYGINELDSTIDHYLWTATHGAHAQALLTLAGPPVKTIAEDFKGKSTAAEIAVSPNGYFLYASNKGEDSLVVFAIDQENGALKLVQRISCGGKGPQHFTIDPTGNWLLCGNEDSDTVTVFKRDGGSGRLDGPVESESVPAPLFTLFD